MSSRFAGSAGARRGALAGLCLFLLSHGAGAAYSVTVDPALELQAGHDSNPRFTAVDEDPAARLFARGTLDLDARAPTHLLELLLDARHVEMVGDPVASGPSFRARAGSTLERERFFNETYVDYNDRATVFAEFDQFGALVIDQREQALTAGTEVGYELGPGWSLIAGASVIWTRVVDDATPTFVDYDLYSGRVGLQRVFSERISGTLLVSRSSYRADNPAGFASLAEQNRIDTDAVDTSVSWAASERLTLEGGVGWRSTDLEAVRQVVPGLPFLRLVRESDSGALVFVAATLEGARWIVDGQFQRRIQPTILGLVEESDSASARLRYQLSERSRLVFSLSAQRGRSLEDLPTPLNRDRAVGEITYVRDFTEAWEFGFQYRTTYQRFVDELGSPERDDPRNRHYVGLQVTYSLAGVPLGRF